ncbi:heme biosynthesis HemY N-terminal domain-containing protein [Candidatus Tisiphia endosymbiont of Hybos culiciformis]|uniref:tetratricopeptide repeat protein n=1 Tax=Candidatus Tisiphia endosymbiont of Hybos culiciformis TaxID=3139331 RepID=UPI003CCB59E3
MIRLLIFCSTFLLLYFSFSMLSQLDSRLTLNLYDYYIETTFFTFVILYILLTLSTAIFFKILFLIINLPSNLKDIFFSKRASNDNYLLMKAMAEYVSGEKSKSLVTSQKISYRLSQENKVFHTLLLAEAETEMSVKIKYFQELEQSKHYIPFVTKRLAQIHYQNNMYAIAENYAVRSFNLNESDSETLEILLNCYAKLALWTKFVFVISKLSRTDTQKLESLKNKIADYYVIAAKNMLEINDTKEAIYYLESAIKLIASHIEALNLYLPLNSSKWNNKNIELLQIAFAENPSFKIVELYKKFSANDSLKIYDDLTNSVDPKQHLELFLAIAVYLDLPEKIKNLKDESESA